MYQPSETVEILVRGAEVSAVVAAAMVKASQWFSVMPLPEGDYEFSFNEQSAQFARTVIARLETSNAKESDPCTK